MCCACGRCCALRLGGNARESGACVAGSVASGATLHRAALVLTEPTPDTGVLAALKRPLQALLHDGAAAADGLGFLDLQQRRTGVADGEEEFRVFLAANGVVTPVHGCSISLYCGQVACECERFHESPREGRATAQFPGRSVRDSWRGSGGLCGCRVLRAVPIAMKRFANLGRGYNPFRKVFFDSSVSTRSQPYIVRVDRRVNVRVKGL